jgi:hypothetical protein
MHYWICPLKSAGVEERQVSGGYIVESQITYSLGSTFTFIKGGEYE